MKAASAYRLPIVALVTMALVGALCPMFARAEETEVPSEDAVLEEVVVQPDELASDEAEEDLSVSDEDAAESDAAEAMTAATDEAMPAGTEEDSPAGAPTDDEAPSAAPLLDTEVILDDGLYIISSVANDSLVLDVASGSTANGAAVQLHTANSTPAQRYRITRDTSTCTYTIINVNSGLALDVKGASTTRGAAIQQWRSNGSASQQWHLYAAGDGSVYLASQLTNAGSPLVMDVPNGKAANGAKMRTWSCNGTVAQRFKFTKIERVIDDGMYEVRSQLGSNLLLDVYLASRANGGNVWTWSCNSSPAQWWRVSYDSSTGYYRLINCNSEKSLDVLNSGYANGTNVQIYTAKAGHKAQTWSIEKNAAGGYAIRSVLSGKALDVANGQKTAGANVRLWNANGSAAQGWTFKAPTLNTIAAGSYQIVALSNMTLGLDVANGSKDDGANVRLWTINDSNAQKWKVGEADSSGWRVIIAAHSGTYLSVNSSGNVCLSTGMSGNSEKWKIRAAGTGYELINKATNKVLDIANGKVAKGTNVRTYKANNTVAQRFALVKTTVKTVGITTGTLIMGKSQVTQTQAVRYLKSYLTNHGYSLPSKWVKDGESVETLVKYFWEEGAAEGVRADVALAQSLHETAYFQFGNLVQPSQYNFAGIGATGPGHPGNTFASARIGIRAQIQHLKAYASTEPLNQAVVDPRFTYVDRGCAPTVQSLGGKWAVPGVGYGQMIVDIMNAMLAA